MEIQNDFPDEEFREPINSSQLLYNNKSQESHCVNMAIDLVFPQVLQCISNEVPALNFLCPTHIDNDGVINIQLLYDSNQLMELELWDGNFHSVSLYGLLEYLFSNISNLKQFMTYIAKYIQNNKIDIAKANDIKDLDGISKAA